MLRLTLTLCLVATMAACERPESTSARYDVHEHHFCTKGAERAGFERLSAKRLNDLLAHYGACVEDPKLYEQVMTELLRRRDPDGLFEKARQLSMEQPRDMAEVLRLLEMSAAQGYEPAKEALLRYREHGYI